ncbi:MAG: cyclic nucleotide-binding and patatin-like phospholipase domain-containing protein, partial [Planctomycetota bacterium]
MDNELVEFLRLHSCSAGLNLSELESIAEHARFKTYGSGEAVIEAGDSFTSLSLVISGLFEAHTSENPDSPIIYLGPRDEIGFLHIIHDSASPVTIRASEPSRVIEIDQHVAKAIVGENKLLERNLYSLSNSHLAKAVSKERKSHLPKHIAFVHSNYQTMQHSQRIQSRLLSLGESVVHITNHDRPYVSSESGFESIQIEGFDNETESKLRSTIAERHEVDRILIDVYFDDSEQMLKMSEKLFSIPERVYLFVAPDDDSLLHQLVAAVEAEPGWKKKINVVWILDEGNRVAPIFPDLQLLCKRVFRIKSSNAERNCVQWQSSTGVERIVHDLRGVKIGLALGGGAARGMCHLGVLRAFDEAGIVIDAISGTSVGAMMGLAYCSGYSPDEAVEMFTSALTPRGIFHLLGDKFYMLFKYQTRAWEDMLRNHFFDWQLEQLLV